MKINVTKFSLTLLAALTLAACGSGGGGGGGGGSEPTSQNKQIIPPQSLSETTPTQENNTQSSAVDTKKPDDNNSPKGDKKDNGLDNKKNEVKLTLLKRAFPSRGEQNTGLALSSDQDAEIEYKLIELSSGDMTQINVDGRVIPLDFDYSDNGWTKKVEPNEENNKKLNGTPYFCCGTYTDVRFGAVENGEAGKSNIIFYTGNPTKQIPDTGKIAYKGESIFSSDDNEKFYNLYTKGTSEFTADFDNKTLSGHIDVNNVKVNINADIAGNRFYGDAESNSLKSKGTAEGRFFGENAKELGGIVEAKDHSWGGSFGAQKAQ